MAMLALPASHLATGCTPRNARYIVRQLDLALELFDAAGNAQRGPVAEAEAALVRARSGQLDLCDVLRLMAMLGCLQSAVGQIGDRLALVEETLYEVIGAEREEGTYQMAAAEADGRLLAELLACLQRLSPAEAEARVQRFLNPDGEE